MKNDQRINICCFTSELCNLVKMIISLEGLIMTVNPMILSIYTRNKEIEDCLRRYLRKMYLGRLTIPIYILFSPILYIIEEIIICYQLQEIQTKFKFIQVQYFLKYLNKIFIKDKKLNKMLQSEKEIVIEFYDVQVKNNVGKLKSMAFEHSIQLSYQIAHLLYEYLNVSKTFLKLFCRRI